MLWPIVLPVKITFWIIAGCVVLATTVAPLMKRKPFPILFVGILVGLVAFVPSCAVVKHFIDAKRFGLFQYATASDITDDHIQFWIPSSARNITVDQQWTGFKAQYEITPTELAAFMEDQWQKYGKYATAPREEHNSTFGNEGDSLTVISAKEFDFYYGELGWPPLENAVEHYGPHAGNGAGFVIWYSPTQQIAYQNVGYW